MLIKSAKQEGEEESQGEDQKILPLPKSLVLIAIGVTGIILGGNLVVDHATIIARMLGMSDTFVGLTIVSVGTSLPELVTSVVAAKKGESGLSLGNALGSNIMNITFILGLASLFTPIKVTMFNLIDIYILCLIALLLFAMAKISEKMSRSRGILFLALYILYMIYIVVR